MVLEKGAEVGAHILSGAVVDPIGIDRLLPGWREEEGHPFKTEVKDDQFLFLGPAGSIRLPNFLMPPLMNNHGNYIVSLGQSSAAGWPPRPKNSVSRVYPGFAATELLYTPMTARSPASQRATWAYGRRMASRALNFARGMELHRQICADRRRRPRLARQATDFSKFDLDEGQPTPQKFGIGIKELWEVDPSRTTSQGLVQHSFGWPLDGMNTGGGSFLYHLEDNLVAVGFVLHLNYKNPVPLSPYRGVPAFQDASVDCADLRRTASVIAYGARAITEGGYQSVPKLTFPGGALIGCSAGLCKCSAYQGFSHNAMLSGMQAAEHDRRRALPNLAALPMTIAAYRERERMAGAAKSART